MSSNEDKFQTGYALILEGLAEMGHSGYNFKGTDSRAAKALHEMVWSKDQINKEVAKILSCSFPDQGNGVYDAMICSTQNIVNFMCPHHLLPVMALVHIAYVPAAERQEFRILGISKLTRLATTMAKQPILQESYTYELATTLHNSVHARGTAVMVEAMHNCMSCRGVQSPTSRITTTTVLGAFVEGHVKAEFIERVSSTRGSLL